MQLNMFLMIKVSPSLLWHSSIHSALLRSTSTQGIVYELAVQHYMVKDVAHPHGTHAYTLAICERSHARIGRVVHEAVDGVRCGLVSGFVGAAVGRWVRAIKLGGCLLSCVVHVVIGFSTTTLEGVK